MRLLARLALAKVFPAHAGMNLRDGRVVYRPVFIGNRGGLVVAQENRDGTVGWTFYAEKRLERRRAGYLLYRR